MIPTVMPASFRPRALTPQDNCDRCGHSADGMPISHAFVRATKHGLDLYFCGHHYTEHETALLVGGWQITDNRSQINTKPGG